MSCDINTGSSHDNYYLFVYNDTYATFMVYMSTLTSLGGFIQVFHVLQHKAGEERFRVLKGISVSAWTLAALSNVFWVVYGMMLADPVIIISCCFGGVGAFIVLGQVYYYHFVYEQSRTEQRLRRLLEIKTNNGGVPTKSEASQLKKEEDIVAIMSILEASLELLEPPNLPAYQAITAKEAMIAVRTHLPLRPLVLLLSVSSMIALYFSFSCSMCKRCVK